MKNVYNLLFGLFFCALSTSFLSAQCLSLPIPLADRVQQSSCIVEARIVAQESFWDTAQRMIFTRHVAEVYKQFKGHRSPETITILTEGGKVGDQQSVVIPSLQLRRDQYGLFLLEAQLPPQLKAHQAPGVYFAPYNQRSCLDYHPESDQFTDPDDGTKWLRERLYAQLAAWLVQQPAVRQTLPFRPQSGVGRNLLATIAGISPTSGLSAGTFTPITITGSGFGSTIGEVLFRDVDNLSTFFAAEDSQVRSWSDNSITVDIPSGAATGTIQVRPNGGSPSESSQSITIDYNVANIQTGSPVQAMPVWLIDDECDGDGGYQLMYSTNTANGGLDFTTEASGAALGAFESALGSWQNTGLAFYADANCTTTTVQQIGNDGINVVMFENNQYTLGGSTVGRATLYFSKCGSSEWELGEVDLVFRQEGASLNGSTLAWGYSGSPQAGKIDFETVALHELGHLGLLRHINAPGEVMHPSVSTNFANTVLGSGELGGTSYVQSGSITYNPPIVSCNPSGRYDCERDYLSFDPTIDCSFLPVDWLSIGATHITEGVAVHWATAQEQDNANFTIERSGDGSSFIPIGQQASQGDSASPAHYEFLDRQPLPGRAYYRIRQTDWDGNFSYSPTAKVRSEAEGVKVFFQAETRRLQVRGARTGSTILLYNTQGQVVREASLSVVTDLRLADLAAGVYFYELRGEQAQTSTGKVILF